MHELLLRRSVVGKVVDDDIAVEQVGHALFRSTETILLTLGSLLALQCFDIHPCQRTGTLRQGLADPFRVVVSPEWICHSCDPKTFSAPRQDKRGVINR